MSATVIGRARTEQRSSDAVLSPRQHLWAEVMWAGIFAAVCAAFPHPFVTLFSLVAPTYAVFLGETVAKLFAVAWIVMAGVYLYRARRMRSQH